MTREEFIKTVPVSKQAVFKRAFDGNRPSAVKAKCLDCSNFDTDEVKNCKIFLCPLYELRPYQQKNKKTESEQENEAED